MPRGFNPNRKKRSTLKIKTLDTNKHGIKTAEQALNGGKYKGIKPLSQVVELSRPNAEFYNSVEWRTLSDQFRTQNPFCFRCNATNKRLLVDHIEEINDNWDRRLDPQNLQVLCYSCHSWKSHQERKKRWAKGGDVSC